jgi:hypothetical protein
MERNTSLNHRTTEEAKKVFNDAYKKLAAELSPNIDFTKEDFFEALLNKSDTICKRDIIKILEGDTIKK